MQTVNNNNQNFSFLGQTFQLKLLSQLFLDRKFSERIINVIQTKYFDNMNYRQIVVFIKDYYEKYENIPTYDNIIQTISLEVKDDIQKEYLHSVVKLIKKQTLEDSKFIQDRALKFCKQQALKKALQYCNKVLERGEFEEYDKLEEKLKEVLTIGEEIDDSVEVLSGIENVLSEEYRNPIPTGISGIDKIIEGGLGKGELGIILGGTGFGKTTFLTKVANSAYNQNYNVLQIIFEDSVKEIKRKHIACWSGISLLKFKENKEKIIERLNNVKSKGKLIIKRFPSDSITINKIKNYIKKLNSTGIKIDMVVLDYLDCVSPNIKYDDYNIGESSVVRAFESMLVEFELVGWTAVQSNRGGLSSDIIQLDKMGGSIKRAQVGHLVISIAKNLEQKKLGLATVAILKSRFGSDGIVFENCTFDNTRVYIDTNSNKIVTSFDYEDNKEENKISQNRERVIEAIAKMKKMKEASNNN